MSRTDPSSARSSRAAQTTSSVVRTVDGDGAHVLVVDGDSRMLGAFRSCLSSRGYRVTAVGDGESALEVAAVDRPELVILDLALPSISGLDVAESLRIDTKTADVPILVVTGRLDHEDRIEGLRHGVDDFIQKPFKHEDLLSRVDVLIQRAERTAEQVTHLTSPDEDRRIRILRQALAEGPESLIPQYDPHTPSGYFYPAAAEVMYEKDAPDPIVDLDVLFRSAYLERSFHDVVLSCPFCTHHDVHLREVCPACGSSDLKPVEMIHHFRCAYVAPIDSFRRGSRLVCPKCRGVLRHIGMDHDKPTDTVMCGGCGAGFQEPDVASRCRNCARPFPPEQAERRRVYSYTLTSAGRFAAEVGSFIQSPGGPDFMEDDLDVYRSEFFRELIQHEVARGTSLGHSTALLRVGVRGLDKVLDSHGQATARQVLREVAQLIRYRTRDVDKTGRMQPTEFLVLVPGGDTRGAVSLARRISEGFDEVRADALELVALSYTWAVHPHEVEDAQGLITRVLEDVAREHPGTPPEMVDDETQGAAVSGEPAPPDRGRFGERRAGRAPVGAPPPAPPTPAPPAFPARSDVPLEPREIARPAPPSPPPADVDPLDEDVFGEEDEWFDDRR